METSHIKRWLTAIIALPLLVLLILKGGAFLFGLVITVISLTAFYEWNKITKGNDKKSIRLARKVPYFLIPFVIFSAVSDNYAHFFIIFLCFGIILLFSLKEFDQTREHLMETVLSISGFFYVCVFLSFVVKIKFGHNGTEGVFLLIMSVFASDTGAYYAGRTYGKTKLMPKVSPKKTVEGFAGGFIFAVVIALCSKFIFFSELSFINALLCGAATGAFVPLGDLFESMVKRVYRVKDSGNILPGHGGILDRIDGLLFAAPVIYLLINL